MTGARTPRGSTAAAKHAPRAARTPFLLVLGGLIVGGFCALLALNTASAANELRRHDFAAGDQSIAAQVAALENAVAASAAPGNVAAAAARLGMVPAGNPAFLVVRANGGTTSVALLGSPAPASGYPTYVPPSTTKAAPKTSPHPSTSRTASSTAKSSPGSSTSAGRASSAPKTSTRPAPPTPSGGTTLPGGDR